MEIIFHMTPNSTTENRYWDKFPELAEYLITKHGATITIVGSSQDQPYVDAFKAKIYGWTDCVVDMTGRTTLDELIDIIRTCDLLVCVNSFVMHLGVALGVPMFAIVGATEPKVVLPPGVPHAYSLYAKDIPLETVLEGIDDIVNGRRVNVYY